MKLLDGIYDITSYAAMRCEPADTIIKAFGGLTAVSRIVDATPGAVIRWRMPKEKGGTGGAIPHWHIPKLLADARAKELGMTAADFFPTDTAGEAA